MRLIPIIFLLLVCFSLARAQTDIETTEGAGEIMVTEERVAGGSQETLLPAVTNTPPTIETHIYSDSVELGIKSRTAIYRGNVRLEDPRIRITCEQLTADVPQEATHVEQVIAETNVVITVIDEKGLTNRAYADRAVYTYQVTESGTNELVELTGDSDPHVERPEGDLYGNPIIWDRTKNQVRAKNQRMTYRGDPAGATNAVPRAETNASREQMKTDALKAAPNLNSVEPFTTPASDE